MQKKLLTLFFITLIVLFQGISTQAKADDIVVNTEIRKLLNKQGLLIQGYPINTSLLNGIYKNFNYKTLWHGSKDSEVFNDDGRKAIEFLSKAEENGLDPANYSMKKINLRLQDNDEKKRPSTDILITQMFVNMVSDIANGKKIEGNWGIEYYLKRTPRVVNYLEVINDFLREDEVKKFVTKYSPPHKGYHNLKVLMAKLLEKRDTVSTHPKIMPGPSIQPGAMDSRIPMIRQALGVSAAGAISPGAQQAQQSKNVYDKKLQKEILNIQQKFGLKTDGVIGNKTIQAINTGPKELIKIVKANMERYRWFSEKFDPDRVVVNVPEFRLRAFENDEEKLSLSTVVGRREKKSPIMATKMTDVIFHPYWYVPQEYGSTQLLPLIKESPKNFLIDEEYTLIDNSNGTWETVDPATVNWDAMTPENFKYILRQDPGSKNALGPIKFNILNHLSIYLHGTTKPWLFEERVRSYSSGCIRIDGPVKLAHFVLKHNKDYSQEEIDELLKAYDNDYEIPYYKKPVHKKMVLEKQITTYLTYFTVRADEEGNYTLFDDIYGWDKFKY